MDVFKKKMSAAGAATKSALGKAKDKTTERLSLDGLLKQARISLEAQLNKDTPENQIPKELLR